MKPTGALAVLLKHKLALLDTSADPAAATGRTARRVVNTVNGTATGIAGGTAGLGDFGTATRASQLWSADGGSEHVKKGRSLLAARGARAVCGLLRMFKRLDVNGDGNGCLRQGGSAIIVLANTRRGSDGGASRRGHAP